jgi:hypothetical protein
MPAKWVHGERMFHYKLLTHKHIQLYVIARTVGIHRFYPSFFGKNRGRKYLYYHLVTFWTFAERASRSPEERPPGSPQKVAPWLSRYGDNHISGKETHARRTCLALTDRNKPEAEV